MDTIATIARTGKVIIGVKLSLTTGWVDQRMLAGRFALDLER